MKKIKLDYNGIKKKIATALEWLAVYLLCYTGVMLMIYTLHVLRTN